MSPHLSYLLTEGEKTLQVFAEPGIVVFRALTAWWFFGAPPPMAWWFFGAPPPKSFSVEEPSQKHSFGRCAPDGGNRIDERDFFWTDLDAVLRFAAVLSSSRSHDGVEALVRVHLPTGVQVEEAHLIDCRGADERALRMNLRACLEAATTRHASRQWIGRFLGFRCLARPWSEGVRSIEMNPRGNALEIVEHPRPIDY